MIRITPTYLKSFFVEIQFDGTFTRFVCAADVEGNFAES